MVHICIFDVIVHTHPSGPLISLSSFCGGLFRISEITLIHQGKGAPGDGATSLEKQQHFGNLTEFDILTKWGLSAPIKRDIYSTFIYNL